MSFGQGFGVGNTGGFSQRPAAGGLFGGGNTTFGQTPSESHERSSAQPTTDQSEELISSLARSLFTRLYFDNLNTDSQGSLFTSGSYSDLTITCGNDQYEVHRAIICPRSAFFKAACNNSFKEAQTGEIHLPDDDPLAMKMMIHYFYHLDYPLSQTEPFQEDDIMNLANQRESFGSVNDGWPTSVPKKKKGKRSGKGTLTGSIDSKQIPNPALHAKVYALGEKYHVSGLKTLAIGKFEDEAQNHWDSPDFTVAIREVYTSTMGHDRSLRNVVVRTLSEHLSLLEKKSVQENIKGFDLGFDLLMHLRKGGRILPN